MYVCVVLLHCWWTAASWVADAVRVTRALTMGPAAGQVLRRPMNGVDVRWVIACIGGGSGDNLVFLGLTSCYTSCVVSLAVAYYGLHGRGDYCGTPCDTTDNRRTSAAVVSRFAVLTVLVCLDGVVNRSRLQSTGTPADHVSSLSQPCFCS